jgi:MoxR-like ATPase
MTNELSRQNQDSVAARLRGRSEAALEAAKYSPPSARRGTPPPLAPLAGAPNASIQAINDAVSATSSWVLPLREELARVIVGQEQLVDRLLVALIGNGHILLEGVPGLAKTLALKTLASATSLHFQRLQFTPDMLPADIVGTMIYNPREGTFSTKHGRSLPI